MPHFHNFGSKVGQMVWKLEIEASQRGKEEIEHVCYPKRKELCSKEEKIEDGNGTRKFKIDRGQE